MSSLSFLVSLTTGLSILLISPSDWETFFLFLSPSCSVPIKIIGLAAFPLVASGLCLFFSWRDRRAIYEGGFMLFHSSCYSLPQVCAMKDFFSLSSTNSVNTWPRACECMQILLVSATPRNSILSYQPTLSLVIC